MCACLCVCVCVCVCVCLCVCVCVSFTAKKFGVTEVPMEAVTFISHATQSRLRSVVEKVSTIAQHRLDSCKVGWMDTHMHIQTHTYTHTQGAFRHALTWTPDIFLKGLWVESKCPNRLLRTFSRTFPDSPENVWVSPSENTEGNIRKIHSEGVDLLMTFLTQTHNSKNLK